MSWRLKECLGNLETGRVSVTGFGFLKERLGRDTTVPAGQTAAQAVKSLQLEAAGGLPVTPVVNGKVVDWGYVLQPGDRLQLMPTLGGG